MKAKTVMKNILRPKSEKEILSSLEKSNLNSDDLLIQSSKAGFLLGVKKALDMGANVHGNNDFALQMASYHGHLPVIEFLLKHGANVHVDNDWVLRYASSLGHLDIVEILLKYGANNHINDDRFQRRVNLEDSKLQNK